MAGKTAGEWHGLTLRVRPPELRLSRLVPSRRRFVGSALHCNLSLYREVWAQLLDETQRLLSERRLVIRVFAGVGQRLLPIFELKASAEVVLADRLQGDRLELDRNRLLGEVQRRRND